MGGTAVYGSASNAAAPWSVAYSFASGTGNKWVVLNKSVLHRNLYGNTPCVGTSRSASARKTYVFYMRSSGYSPRVQYYNGGGDADLYRENGDTSYTTNLSSFQGADVYVR